MAIFKALGIILLSLSLSGCALRVHKKESDYPAKEAARQDQSLRPISIREDLEAISPDKSNLGVCGLPAANKDLADDYSLEVATDLKLLPLAISRLGYTRLTIEDERITDVFVYPQEALQVKIHNQGYLIMVADPEWIAGEENKNKSVYITITGEEGTTQDLSLRFTGKDPEPVKLIKFRLGDNLTKHGE